MTRQEIEELDSLITNEIWSPLPGPQTEAYYSKADILGYGGAAGGGKTDLICGLMLTHHVRSIVFRKEGTQLYGVHDRLEEILGTRDGFNSQKNIWRHERKIMEFGGMPKPTDYKKYQGRPHDIKAFDEATEMSELEVRFLMGWNRSPDPKQRKRVIMTFNPPTTLEGRWVVDYFGPWLNPNHPNKAKPGELRYYTTDPETGRDVECEGPEPIMMNGEMVTPMSRTFIPASVEDNPFYMESGYKSALQALPEPLRSQMLKGDFMAGTEDNPFQVIPSSWVTAAMERWQAYVDLGKPGLKPMDSVGVDVARGGKDKTIIATRHGTFFDELQKYPGTETPDGPNVAALCVNAVRDQAPIHIDANGVGASPYDHLKGLNVHVVGMIGSKSTNETDITGLLGFANVRSMLYWKMREALDPKNGQGLMIPNDDNLRADLCTPLWKPIKGGIAVETKEDLVKRLHRSTDEGDTIVLANIDTPKKVTQIVTKPIPTMKSAWPR